jgi:hypothetical protein
MEWLAIRKDPIGSVCTERLAEPIARQPPTELGLECLPGSEISDPTRCDLVEAARSSVPNADQLDRTFVTPRAQDLPVATELSYFLLCCPLIVLCCWDRFVANTRKPSLPGSHTSAST